MSLVKDQNNHPRTTGNTLVSATTRLFRLERESDRATLKPCNFVKTWMISKAKVFLESRGHGVSIEQRRCRKERVGNPRVPRAAAKKAKGWAGIMCIKSQPAFERALLLFSVSISSIDLNRNPFFYACAYATTQRVSEISPFWGTKTPTSKSDPGNLWNTSVKSQLFMK